MDYFWRVGEGEGLAQYELGDRKTNLDTENAVFYEGWLIIF